MNQLPLLGAQAIVPIISFLLSSIPAVPNSGLDTRPINRTCIAEHITPQIVVKDAFPGTRFLAPMAMKQSSADPSRIYIAEKGGNIQLMLNGVKQPTPFLDISSKVSSGGEQGLLGLAIHPSYSTNHFFYVSYTDSAGTSVVSRFTRSATDPNLANPNSESVILTLPQPYSNHNGGNIEFGPDHYLYIGFGDGGSGGDPLEHGQDTSTWLGAMLRVDVNNSPPYSIPPDNPFSNQSCDMAARTGTCPEIYAYGLRNPWRFSFDSTNGDLWVGDVGQNQIEEVDMVTMGDNLGWRCFEGTDIYNFSGCDSITAVPPVAQYSHSGGRCSITGGYVYRGGDIPELGGYYLYGDYCTGEIWGYFSGETPDTVPLLLARANGNIYSFAEGINREVYVLQSSGIIGKIELDPSGGGEDPVPDFLSQTGCVDENDPRQPVTGMIPYDINAPFWSDGAHKLRWLAIPETYTIDNTDLDWYFPIGTVLIKQFELGGKLIETRHLKHHTNGTWAGYTYEWNEVQTDAQRIKDGKTVTIDNNGTLQQWVFPSEAECMVCHTAAAGVALGPEPAQLNKDFSYTLTGRTENQLNTASQIGLLTNSLSAPPAQLPALTDPYASSATLGNRARSWLHTNCAGCHRTGGSTNSAMDLQAETLLSNTNSCNVPASSTGAGWPAVILTPENAAASLLHYRANSRDITVQMPPIGSTIVDEGGIDVLENWINSLSNCSP